MGVAHTLVTSGLAGAAAAIRAGARVTGLAVRRVPSLVAAGTRATVTSGNRAARAETVFRDELLTLLDDAAEIAWRQARRARFELGNRTGAAAARRPAPHPGQHADEGPAENGGPPRRHRVKA